MRRLDFSFIKSLKHCDSEGAKLLKDAAADLRYAMGGERKYLKDGELGTYGRNEKFSDADYDALTDTFSRVCTTLDAIGGQAMTHSRDGRIRLDSQLALYSTRQLEQILTESYEEEFAELRLANGDLVPIEGDLNAGAKTWTYYVYTANGGVAQFMAGYASGDMPIVDVQGVEVTRNIHWIHEGYAYTVKDLAHAAFANDNLDSRNATAAKRAHMEQWQLTGLWGREDLNIYGLLNHPNITVSDAADNGSGSTFWSAKTPTQIIADVNTLINTVDELTFGIETVTRVVIARPEYNLIKTTQLSNGADGTSTTILKYLREIWNDEGRNVEFQVLNELDAANSDGNLSNNSMFAYPANNAKKLSFKVAMDYTQHPIQQEDLNLKVPAVSAIGGIKCPVPLALHRMDGIGASS